MHYVLILPWFGCYRHFSQTNKLLEKAGHLPIDWQLWNYNPCILATVFSRFLDESAKLSGDCLSHIHGDDVLHFCSAVGELCHKFAFTKGYRNVPCFCSAVWVFPQIYLHKRLQGLPHFCSAVFPYICFHKRLQGLPTSVQLFEFSHTFAFPKGYRVCHTCSAVWVFLYICLHKRRQHTRNKPPMVWNKVNWVNCLSTLAVGIRIERHYWKDILSKEYRMWN